MSDSRIPPARMAFLAAALSFVVPGVGQFLLRAWVRGAIWLAGWLVLAALSGGGHSLVVLALMAIAAVDAYAIARSEPEPRGPAALEGGPEERERR